MTIRTVVVDDDPLVRTGLRMLLAGDPAVELVAELADGDEVVACVRDHAPDVILLDIRMPRVDGITAVRRLLEEVESPPAVVMLTTFDADQTVLDALRAGAAGYLVKHAPPEQIVSALHHAAAGEPVFSASALHALVGHTRSEPSRPPGHDEQDAARAAFGRLGDRERQIAKAVAAGKSNAEIAAELYLSTGTVKAAISGMLTKLDVANRTQLAILAYQAGRSAPSDPT